MAKAIRPSYFADFRELSSLKTEKKPDDQDIHLSNLAKSKGWQILQEYIDDLIKSLDNMVLELMNQGASFDLIGQKTVAKEIAKELLNRVKYKVLDAKEALERPDGTQVGV